MELTEAYSKIFKILQKADKDTNRIMNRENYCAGWEGFFNLQDTRITKANAFDKIHAIVMQIKPQYAEAEKVNWDIRKESKKPSLTS